LHLVFDTCSSSQQNNV